MVENYVIIAKNDISFSAFLTFLCVRGNSLHNIIKEAEGTHTINFLQIINFFLIYIINVEKQVESN